MRTTGGKLSFLKILYVISISLFILTLLRGLAISDDQINIAKPGESEIASAHVLEPLNEEWTLIHADGREEIISLPAELPDEEGGVTVKKDVTGLLRMGDVLSMQTYRQETVVSSDGLTVFETNTTPLRRQVMYFNKQIISLPHASGVEELSIRVANSESGTLSLPDVFYGTYRAARNDLIIKDIVTLLTLIILIILCFVVFVTWLTCIINKLESVRVLDLAVFIMTGILWGFADSNIAALSGLPQEFLGLLTYLSLMALPIPICHFVWISCGRKYNSLRVMSYICEVNMIVQVVLSFFGVFQIHDTMYLNHALILMVIINCVVCISKERGRFNSADTRILQYGVVFLSAMSVLSVLIYWRAGGFYYRSCMLIGIFVFSLIMFIYVLALYSSKLHDIQLKEAEGRIHEQLAMYDALTGLPNRRSFENKLEEIEQMDSSVLKRAELMILDVNGLKIVNEQFGHNAGDDLIISAGRVISQTFAKEGSCYRIGGDEFAVIMTEHIVPVSTYERELDENIETANKGSLWKLSVARGCSSLINDFDVRKSISDWKQEADVNMYRNKVSMAGSQNRDRAKDLNDVINCIISTIEAKDFYTAAHSERVRELSCVIAEKLGLSGSTILNIEMSSRLHDIGKVGIPDDVLRKPGKLSDEEYEIIKKHCRIGAGILSQAKGMQEIANIVLHHHERWDGTGYPDALKQNEIPLESRIIAVADSIDAITSKRVYRDRMSVDDCREAIQKNAGIMYDPAVVQIVMEHWSDIVDIILLHPKQLVDNREEQEFKGLFANV